jgi:hypothetical protein
MDAVISRSLARHFIQRGARSVDIALVGYNASCPREWGAITVDCYQSLLAATSTSLDFHA